MIDDDANKLVKELRHEPMPGYPTIFAFVALAMIAYLTLCFLSGGDLVGPTH